MAGHMVLESKGRLVESRNGVSVYEGIPYFFYESPLPVLSESDARISDALSMAVTGKIGVFSLDREGVVLSQKFLDGFSQKIVAEINVQAALDTIPSQELLQSLSVSLSALLAEFVPTVSNPAAVGGRVIEDSVGFGVLSGLMADQQLEEVMVNGVDRPVFVFHRTFGMAKTNVVFSNPVLFGALVRRIGRTVGKPFDENFPLLDARLPDGSRVNATFSSVSPKGATLTVRKFLRANFSVCDLVSRATLSSEAAAFLWVMADGLGVQPMNMILTGGTGSGKTTLLGCLASFSPISKRIVSIEDTLEIDLGERSNWVQLESRPRTRSTDAVTMEELLQNSLRMRPDRLVVGEVRGAEAQTLFVAMDTGHDGTLGTVHANSAKELMLRLKSHPMNVPESMLGLLDLVVVSQRLFLPQKGLVRRVTQIAEVSSMEEKPLLSTLFEWNRKTDLLSRTDTPSHVIQVLSETSSLSSTEIRREMSVRKELIEWMLRQKISAYSDVQSVVQRYYLDPESVLSEALGKKK
ncbi:MAG: ATPase, T2SS/T4P/T4SS family [Candidatus Diapherotrites archaeon]|nr:ATPase, T2SS/T4P/T4SS family [Candidatus Diapherotrites archaeon]